MAYYRIISFALLLYSCQNFTRKESNIKSTDLVKEWISLSPEDNFNGWHIFQNENGSKSGWKVGFWNGNNLVEHKAEYLRNQ